MCVVCVIGRLIPRQLCVLLARSHKVPCEDVLCNWEINSQIIKMCVIILGPTVLVGTEKSAPEFLCPEFSFLRPPGVMGVRAFGSWMSAPKRLFFQGFEGTATLFWTRGVRTNYGDPDVRGISGPRTFSLGCFLSFPKEIIA